MIGSMEHIGLCASDPKALAAWYVTHLEFVVVRALEESRVYFIRCRGGGMLEIYPAAHQADPVDNVHRGLRHIALGVSDIEAEVTRLSLAGISVPEETMVTTPHMRLAFFKDPEGNLIHLVQRNEEIPPYSQKL